MKLTQDHRELEAALQPKLRELEQNLPTRARRRAATEPRNRWRVPHAQRRLDRLKAEYGPDPQHVQS